MDTAVKRLYEGLFLVDSGQAAADWDGVISAIEKILKRADAEVLTIKKWDERKLAYDVEGKARGTYILVYFKGDTSKIGSIERDVQLSENIMRVLILRTEKMSQKEMAKEVPFEIAEKRAAKAAAAAEKAKAKKKEPEAAEETEVESSEKPTEEPSFDTEPKEVQE